MGRTACTEPQCLYKGALYLPLQWQLLTAFPEQTYRSHIQGSRIQEHSLLLKMGPGGCSETSVRNCHYTLHNRPEECSSPIIIGLGIKGANSEIKLLARVSGFVFY